ncbi:MAG: ABC transporter permease subunit [Paenibacillaceae bacterium]
MRQWIVMYNKEMLEMWRSFKWLWVPLVFILLGIMQPVTTYYLPQILERAGGLPEGAVIEIPLPTGAQVMAEVVSQYSTMGILILVLAGMAIVAGEKQSRSIGLILVRPVPHATFITAKWAGLVTLTISSLLLGCLAGWYYTELLFDHVNVGHLMSGVLVYGFWLIFVITILVLMSTLLRGNSAVAFVTVLIAVSVSVLTGVFERWMLWSPARLTHHTSSLLVNGATGEGFLLSMGVTFMMIIAILMAAVLALKRQELGD